LVIFSILSSSPITSAQTASPESVREVSPESDQTVTLSPYIITEKKEDGYFSEQTLLGSRNVSILREIPGNISIINRELLENLGALSMHTVIGYGASGIAENASINDDFNIRGFRSLGTLRNGTAKPTFKRSPTFGIDRIEVIKGPAAMLTGNNSYLGGAVNFISRKPTDTPAADYSLSLSDNNFIRTELNSSGPIFDKSVNGEKLTVSYLVNLGYWKDDKWKEIESIDDKYIGGALRLKFGAKTTITLEAFNFMSGGYEYDTDIWDPVAAANGEVKPNPFTANNWSPGRSQDAFWNVDEYNSSIEILHSFSESSNIRAYFVRVDGEDRRQHLTGDSFRADNVTIDRSVLPIDIDNKVSNFQLDYLQKLSLGPISNEISVGLDYASSGNLQRLDYYTIDPINVKNPDFSKDDVSIGQHGVTWISNRNTYVDTFSYYIHNNAKLLNDKLILVGGLRWISSDRDSHNVLNKTYTSVSNKTFPAHKYGIVYLPNDSLSFYATEVATKFVTTRGSLNGGTIWEEAAKDSVGELKEVGVKFRFLNNAVYGTVSCYDMAKTAVLSDRNVIDPATNLTRRIEAYSDDTSKGWDIDFGFRYVLQEEYRIDVVGNMSNGEFLTAAGDPTPNTPKKSAGILAKLTLDGGPLKGLSFGAGVRHQGEKIYIGLKNQWPTTANLFASYAWSERFSLKLNVDNLTDERYLITSVGVSQVSDPRRIRLQGKYSW